MDVNQQPRNDLLATLAEPIAPVSESNLQHIRDTVESARRQLASHEMQARTELAALNAQILRENDRTSTLRTDLLVTAALTAAVMFGVGWLTRGAQ